MKGDAEVFGRVRSGVWRMLGGVLARLQLANGAPGGTQGPFRGPWGDAKSSVF